MVQYSLIVIYITYDKYTPCTVHMCTVMTSIFSTVLSYMTHHDKYTPCTVPWYTMTSIFSIMIVIYDNHDKYTPCTVPCVHNDLNILYWLSYITHHREPCDCVYTWYSTWCILIMYVLYMTISREYWGHCVHMVQYMVYTYHVCVIYDNQ